MAVFGRILLFFSSFVLLKKCPKINFWQENRLLWHLWCFLAFFTCSSLYELVRARTSPKKFSAGLLMLPGCPISILQALTTPVGNFLGDGLIDGEAVRLSSHPPSTVVSYRVPLLLA